MGDTHTSLGGLNHRGASVFHDHCHNGARLNIIQGSLTNLLTFEIRWFYTIPQYFMTGTVIFIAIIGIIEYKKKT